MSHNLFDTLQEFKMASGKTGKLYSLPALERALGAKVSRLPVSIRIVLESVLRHCDGKKVTEEHVRQLANWKPSAPRTDEIPFVLSRILLQDLTGIPSLADLAAMRSVAQRLGKNPKVVEPLVPVDLVVDHSIQIDHYGVKNALDLNMKLEFKRNQERYTFMKWAMQAFDTFRVVPPGIGIVHQVNLEYLARGVHKKDGLYYPDTLVGTDSHTPMVNAIGVVAWGVGGIEAEAGMLGQPTYILTPDVVGVHLKGSLRGGVTATDLVLTVTELMRKTNVVNKFVEFFGEGTASLTVPDRATIANMAPDYGATMGFFPVDDATIVYFEGTGRTKEEIDALASYFKAQGMYGTIKKGAIDYSQVVELDLAGVTPSLAGPKRPQDRIEIGKVKAKFTELFSKSAAENGFAKKAVERGLTVKPHVKTSLAPGSRVVTEYLKRAGLTPYLEKLGFNLAAYGCTTCIGNSGPLKATIEEAIAQNDLVCAAVLSGNRNFEARIHASLRANFLASPPLVVTYALAGTVLKDLMTEPLGKGKKGEDVWIGDIWPSAQEIQDCMKYAMDPKTFQRLYSNLADANPMWTKVPSVSGQVYTWPKSTYIAEPPFFKDFSMQPRPGGPIRGARVLGIFGDSLTTDHISPAGSIKPTSPAGTYLLEHDVAVSDFNSFGARRGNHEIMMRGTFGNVRIKNLMLPVKPDGSRTEGGITLHQPSGEQMPIYEAAMKYTAEGVPTVVFGGEEYGTGSSRDWAAKGTLLLGVRAVIVKSFERIHRSNLVGMGVLPFQFKGSDSVASLGITGEETIDIRGVEGEIRPQQDAALVIRRADGSVKEVPLLLRIDTPIEVDYYQHGGILPFVLREILGKAGPSVRAAA